MLRVPLVPLAPTLALLLSAILWGACGTAASPVPRSQTTSAPSIVPPLPTTAPSPPPTSSPRPLSAEEEAAVLQKQVARVIDRIDPAKLNDHLNALAATVSRDPRHPGHAKAVAYVKEQLALLAGAAAPGAPGGVRIETHRASHQGIPLESIFAVIDPLDGAPPDGWVMIAAHYDTTANRTPGWRPAVDPAPGADDNGTGTAALLEYARVLAAARVDQVSEPPRSFLRQRVVLAFFDGEEFFFKGSAAYLQSLPKPYPYAWVVNIDMVGQNPVADRLDLIWYGAQSDKLRDRVKDANQRYQIGVSPLIEIFANDPNQFILDTAPFGLAGIPSISLVQRYGDPDATYPGNPTFHTVGDTPERITNKRLWLKASKLTLAVALELASR